MSASKVLDPFYEHLGSCEQCRDRPFNLCSVGESTLTESMANLG